jgi:DNA-binding MarR family transcriptional regulator
MNYLGAKQEIAMPNDPHITTPRPLRDLDERTRAIVGTFVLFRKLEEQLEQINIDPPLSKAERHLIMVLAQPTRMGVLAQELQALPSTLTAMADSLEQKGFVERQRDPDDRRAWLLGLTDAGRELRNTLSHRAAEAFSSAAGLPADDVSSLARLLAEVGEQDYRTRPCAGETP